MKRALIIHYMIYISNQASHMMMMMIVYINLIIIIIIILNAYHLSRSLPFPPYILIFNTPIQIKYAYIYIYRFSINSRRTFSSI